MTTRSQMTFGELVDRARSAAAPAIVKKLPLRPGGVDPLGLRQINFDLMDQVVPGLNNAATRLRPCVVVTWAWWKAVELARERGGLWSYDVLKNFVDRIEVLFVASHIQAGEMDGLLGARVLNRYRGGATEIELAGPRWEALRRSRANTSLMAPVAYGPSIRVGAGLGFLRSDDEGLLVPMAEVMPAVEAFNSVLGPMGDHPALSSLEATAITDAELEQLHQRWRASDLTEPERRVGRRRLVTDPIAAGRRPMIELLLWQLRSARAPMEVNELRAVLAHRGAEATPDLASAQTARATWRVLQTQQLFRFALEALLVWVLRTIGTRPATLAELRDKLLPEVRGTRSQSFGAWLLDDPFTELDFDPVANPVAMIDLIDERTWDEPWASDALDGVRAAMRIADMEGQGSPLFGGQFDRLPLAQALRRARLLSDLAVDDALEGLISEWLIGQHVYWAVGRSGDETQRLRLILEEGGWTSAIAKVSSPASFVLPR